MKKGFTLIELLAVIAILAIVLLIIMPQISNTLSTSKTKLNDTQIEMIENAARNWGVVNVKIDEETNKAIPTSVTIAELQQSGYLEDEQVKNLEDKSNLKGTYKVCIKYQNNQYEYEYKGSGNCN